MSNLYENMTKEIKIKKHAKTHNLNVVMQLCTKNCVMFTVHEKHLEEIKNFCQKEFGSCETVEETGQLVMCKVV